jgi:hypothetical protein
MAKFLTMNGINYLARRDHQDCARTSGARQPVQGSASDEGAKRNSRAVAVHCSPIAFLLPQIRCDFGELADSESVREQEAAWRSSAKLADLRPSPRRIRPLADLTADV